MLERASPWLFALAFLTLAGCEKSDPQAATGATAKPATKDLKLPEVSRKFLVVEPVGATQNDFGRSYFGRTAFRPKALSAVTAPFAGRIAAVGVEPGQKVRAGATLFTIESADVLGLRTTLSQARLKLRLAEEQLARQTEMMKRGVGLEMERFEAEV